MRNHLGPKADSDQRLIGGVAYSNTNPTSFAYALKSIVMNYKLLRMSLECLEKPIL